jgi:outer membrane protein OmpA-like peptidoglycan-associated protein
MKESPRPPRSDAPDTVQQIAVFLTGDSSVEEPRRFVLGDLSFQSGSATLTQESQETVDALAKVLRANPTVEIALEGHTDNTGSAAANKALSTARAAAIEDGLVGAGVPGERIMVAGYGPDRPVASNDTEEGRARNRRTEVVVVNR